MLDDPMQVEHVLRMGSCEIIDVDDPGPAVIYPRTNTADLSSFDVFGANAAAEPEVAGANGIDEVAGAETAEDVAGAMPEVAHAMPETAEAAEVGANAEAEVADDSVDGYSTADDLAALAAWVESHTDSDIDCLTRIIYGWA